MLAREGLAPLLAVLAVAAGVAYLAGVAWSVPLWLAGVVVLVVFYERTPVVPATPLAVVSPTDGRVSAVGRREDPWVHREALAIALEVPFPGITRVLSPSEGKVMDFLTNLGAADAPTDSPTAYVQWLRTDEDDDVCVCTTTRRHSRFKAKVAPGERVGQGGRNGFVYFATSVTVFVPPGSAPEVEVGERVRAGSSIVASLVRDRD